MNQIVQSKYVSVFLTWGLTSVVVGLAIIAWGQLMGWNLTQVDAYQFFPLLGLIAFSIMWTHYVVGTMPRAWFEESALRKYFRYTGYGVLAAIVLHPGLLVYQRFRDGYGLPPGSYESFVGPSMAWIAMLGSVSLLVFLAYELHRWYADRSWWKYILAAGDAAMLAIFYHGLSLGGQLQGGWYRYVWLLYGGVLVTILVWKYYRILFRHSTELGEYR